MDRKRSTFHIQQTRTKYLLFLQRNNDIRSFISEHIYFSFTAVKIDAGDPPGTFQPDAADIVQIIFLGQRSGFQLPETLALAIAVKFRFQRECVFTGYPNFDLLFAKRTKPYIRFRP